MHTLEQLRSGQLLGITRLKLSCGLTEFPREIFELADTLEILDLSSNAMSTLPGDLARLTRLRVLFCSDNDFTELPAVLGGCARLTMIAFKANRIEQVPAAALPAQLRWLILTDNKIAALPPEIGQCRQLQKLMLAGNALQALPAELAACDKLELLRIAANRLSALPEWLFALPRLTWLAYGGNPFCEQHEADALAAALAAALADGACASIAWQSLELQQKLGEGASGVIHQARYKAENQAKDQAEDQAKGQAPESDAAGHNVAIKLFKGALTSDGLPRSEMAACIAAGKHANLIEILGTLDGHPQRVDGLVMTLIDAGFGNLAGPPSLESCTRDVYAADKRFDRQQLLGIAQGIASATGHLHRLGIMHGDLYGHNILHRSDGAALLGDFGAACFHVPDAPHALPLQRLEVRAFGVLLGELLSRCDMPATEHSAVLMAGLSELVTACLHDDSATRPLFGAIEQRLSSLGAKTLEAH